MAVISARTVSDVERGLRTKIYRDTAERLAGALGLEGTARAEFEEAARGRRGATPSSSDAGIRRPPTRLIGRDREVDATVAALGRADLRAVTLVGPGGIGKTRVALESASRASFADGTVFVGLGELSDPRQVMTTIARAISLPATEPPTVEAIAGHIGGRQMLIVLDTFEHVVDAATDVAALLTACSGVTVLTTTRAALRIRGEHVIVIPPLAVPARPTREDVIAASATALFIERALTAGSESEVEEDDLELITDICRRLGGIPLAIELAAARVRHLSLKELRDLLERRLDLLASGPRDLPRRQRTMRDTIAWSYDLLSDREQEVFRDLCVFSGGWTLDAASAVCDGEVLEIVGALVDKSLVVHDPREGRYSMLDLLRDYGRELGASPGVEERYLAYFLDAVEQGEPRAGEISQSTWMLGLGRNHENIEVALRIATERADADAALRLATGVWRFWMQSGYLSEGREWLRAALALDEGEVSVHRQKALWGSAWLAYHQGDYSATARYGAEMQQLASIHRDAVDLRNAMTVQGIVALAEGRLSEAIELLERCVDLLAERDPDWLLATSLLNLGMATAHARDDRAASVLAQARQLYEKLGDEPFAGRCDVYSGYASLLRGDPEAATSFFRRSVIAFWEVDDLWGMTESLEGISAALASGGLGEPAAVIAGACEALRKATNRAPFPADRAVVSRILAQTRSAMEQAAWEEAWARGESMTTEEVVDLALAAVSQR